MVSKEDLLKYATDQAIEEANRRHLDSLATKELLAEAREIIEDIFLSINWTKAQRDTANSKNSLATWRHRTVDDRESDWRYLSFAKTELQHAAERYLQASWLHCQTLDWLVLNTLTYGDYLAMLDTIRARTMPLSRYQSRKSGKANFRVLAELWRAALLILKITAWFIIFAAVSPASPIGPLLWIALTGWWLWRKWAIRKRNTAILKAMFSTYTTLSTTYQGWPRMWEELKKSQELGALWNSLVYRLVEEKMQRV
jgi:hypothetical protein